jgi:hypothetical protein
MLAASAGTLTHLCVFAQYSPVNALGVLPLVADDTFEKSLFVLVKATETRCRKSMIACGLSASPQSQRACTKS